MLHEDRNIFFCNNKHGVFLLGGPILEFPTKTGSQCFHVKGVPTLKLRCPGGELINVQSAFFGAPKTTVCKYNLTENHCIQLADLQENCMGRYMCSVYVSNPFLMNCRTYASYMQVNYTCVPSKRNTLLTDFYINIDITGVLLFL